MDTTQLFLASDAALRSVIDRISPADFDQRVPSEWSSTPDPTIRDILSAHAYDEAWIPGVLAGASIVDGDEFRDRDLLGDDPIAAYDALNEAATAAVERGVAHCETPWHPVPALARDHCWHERACRAEGRRVAWLRRVPACNRCASRR